MEDSMDIMAEIALAVVILCSYFFLSIFKNGNSMYWPGAYVHPYRLGIRNFG